MNAQYGYLLPTDVHTTVQHIVGNVDQALLPKANVLCAFSDGNYALCLITPPERSCKVFISSRGDVLSCDVVDLFCLCQDSISWSVL